MLQCVECWALIEGLFIHHSVCFLFFCFFWGGVVLFVLLWCIAQFFLHLLSGIMAWNDGILGFIPRLTVKIYSVYDVCFHFLGFCKDVELSKVHITLKLLPKCLHITSVCMFIIENLFVVSVSNQFAFSTHLKGLKGSSVVMRDTTMSCWWRCCRNVEDTVKVKMVNGKKAK